MHSSCQIWTDSLHLSGQSCDYGFVAPHLEQSIGHILQSLGWWQKTKHCGWRSKERVIFQTWLAAYLPKLYHCALHLIPSLCWNASLPPWGNLSFVVNSFHTQLAYQQESKEVYFFFSKISKNWIKHWIWWELALIMLLQGLSQLVNLLKGPFESMKGKKNKILHRKISPILRNVCPTRWTALQQCLITSIGKGKIYHALL